MAWQARVCQAMAPRGADVSHPPYPFSREHFRVQYPAQVSPRLELHDSVHRVIDVGEGGLRYVAAGAPEPVAGAAFQGLVRFHRGEIASIRGEVLRVVNGEVSVRLESGVPCKIVLDEQQYLLEQQYGLNW
jgi:hypothetical protein